MSVFYGEAEHNTKGKTMTTKEFIVIQTMSADTKYIEKVKQNTFDHIDELLKKKGGEYSTETNRFENFLDTGRMEKETPEKALWGMVVKHWVSVRKFVMELVTDKRRSVDKWSEKIDDIITYLILLKAMIRRRTHIEQVIDANQLKKIAGEKEAEADKYPEDCGEQAGDFDTDIAGEDA